MIEKKLILCGILAVAIGIATVVPMEYLMAAQAQANTETAQAQVKAQAQANAAITYAPWFNVSVPYVYVNLDQSGSNGTASWNGVSINGLINFTATPAAINLEGALAKIEYYQLAVSSNEGPIVNISYSIAFMIEKLGVAGYPGGCYLSITGLGDNTYTFANNITINGVPNYKGDVGGAGMMGDIIGDTPPGATNETFATDVFTDSVLNYNGGNSQVGNEINELRNAQTLSIDVTSICTVMYNGNVTITTPSTNQVLQHIELTKTNGGFVYGTYTQGEAPFPMETP